MKTIEGTIDDFLRLAALNSAHTGRAYKAALRHHFLTFLHEAYELAPEAEPAELTLEHARQFAIWLADLTGPGGQPLSDASRALYLSALARYYRYLLGNSLLANVDSTAFEILRADLAQGAKRELPPLGQRLPQQEFVAALVTAAESPPSITEETGAGHKRRLLLTWQRNLAIVLTLKNTGVRSGELVGLCRRDLDYADQGAWVKGKGKKWWPKAARYARPVWAEFNAASRKKSSIVPTIVFINSTPPCRGRGVVLSPHTFYIR